MKARSRKSFRRKRKRNSSESFFQAKEKEAVNEVQPGSFFSVASNASKTKVVAKAGGEETTDTPTQVPGTLSDVPTISIRQDEPKGVVTSSETLVCDPKEVTRTELMGMGSDRDKLGLTTFEFTKAQLDINLTESNGQWKLQSMADNFGPIASFYVGPETFQEGTAPPSDSNTECTESELLVRHMITKAGSDLIAVAEMEHCADFQLAYQLSIKKYVDTVNTYAAAEKLFGSADEAKLFLQEATGVHPDLWFETATCLVKKTTIRDSKGWHSVARFKMPTSKTDNGCEQIVYKIDGRSLPNVRKHPPSEIIKDCP